MKIRWKFGEVLSKFIAVEMSIDEKTLSEVKNIIEKSTTWQDGWIRQEKQCLKNLQHDKKTMPESIIKSKFVAEKINRVKVTVSKQEVVSNFNFLINIAIWKKLKVWQGIFSGCPITAKSEKSSASYMPLLIDFDEENFSVWLSRFSTNIPSRSSSIFLRLIIVHIGSQSTDFSFGNLLFDSCNRTFN